MKSFSSVLALSLLVLPAGDPACADETPGWTASAAAIERASKNKPNSNFDESKVGAYQLADPLIATDGSPVTRETWPRRRAELLKLFGDDMFGHAPIGQPENLSFRVVEEDLHALDDKATRKLVEISCDTPHAGRFSFPVQLFLPKSAKGPVPALILLQFKGLDDPATPQIIERGYALAILDRTALAADDANTFRAGVINAFSGDGELAPDAWQAFGAWAWGGSRVMDYLETDAAVDATLVSVVGFSRMGKTALWAGAQDERFAAVIANESGAGGAALSNRRYGETIEDLNVRFPHWFCKNYRKYNGREGELPFDDHMLLALIAPRPLYVGSADEDLWSDPRGEFLSCVAASPVYELLDVPGLGTDQMPPLDQPVASGHIAYHVRRGRHAFTDYDWQRYMDFLDRQLPSKLATVTP